MFQIWEIKEFQNFSREFVLLGKFPSEAIHTKKSNLQLQFLQSFMMWFLNFKFLS